MMFQSSLSGSSLMVSSTNSEVEIMFCSFVRGGVSYRIYYAHPSSFVLDCCNCLADSTVTA